MLCSINKKLEKFLVKDVYFLLNICFAVLHSIFSGEKGMFVFFHVMLLLVKV